MHSYRRALVATAPADDEASSEKTPGFAIARRRGRRKKNNANANGARFSRACRRRVVLAALAAKEKIRSGGCFAERATIRLQKETQLFSFSH
jgi:hypothetical protein